MLTFSKCHSCPNSVGYTEKRGESMFGNAGERLMRAARIFFVFGVITSCAGGGVLIASGTAAGEDEVWRVLLGIAVTALGCALSRLVSLYLCAIGEIAENSGRIAFLTADKTARVENEKTAAGRKYSDIIITPRGGDEK